MAHSVQSVSASVGGTPEIATTSTEPTKVGNAVEALTAPELHVAKPERAAWRKKLSRIDEKVSPYLYVSPFFIVFAIVGLYPLLYTAWVSLHDWTLLGGQGEFVGWDNFASVLSEPRFYTAVRNTFSIFILSSVPQIIGAILIAAVLNANLRAKTFWRMGVLLPYVVAPVAVSLIFSKMFGDQAGLINTIIGYIGIDPIGWHANAFASHIAMHHG